MRQPRGRWRAATGVALYVLTIMAIFLLTLGWALCASPARAEYSTASPSAVTALRGARMVGPVEAVRAATVLEFGGSSSLESLCYAAGGTVVGGCGAYSCHVQYGKHCHGNIGLQPRSSKQDKNTFFGLHVVCGPSVSESRLFRAFLNGLWGSASNDDDVVTNSPEGERVDSVKRYWYTHRKNQRSGASQNPRSVNPPAGGWRPRSPRLSFWGRTVGAESSDEEFVDLEGGCVGEDDCGEEVPLLSETNEEGGAAEKRSSMNVEFAEPTAPVEGPGLEMAQLPPAGGEAVADSPDLSGPGPESVVCDGLEPSIGPGCVRIRLYRVQVRWASLSCGQEWLVTPFVGGEEAEIAFALGFRSYRWVEVDPISYESAYRKIAGMRVTSGHTIDAIRYQCQTLGADLEELPRALLQRLMFCRVRDNVSGAGETGVSVSTLNSMAPGSSMLGSFAKWLWMSPWMFLMSTIFFSVVLTRGVVRASFVVVSRRSLRAVRTDRELSDIGRSLAQLFVIGGWSMMSLIVLWGLVAIVFFMTKWVWVSCISGSLPSLVRWARSLGRELSALLRKRG